jgi:uncharacterized membrane protein
MLMGVTLIAIPFLISVFLTVNRSKLNQDAFKVRYGAMYQNLKA